MVPKMKKIENTKRIRTIESAYQEIIRIDANTAISRNCIRQLIINGVIPSRKIGKKYVFNLDALIDYLASTEYSN